MVRVSYSFLPSMMKCCLLFVARRYMKEMRARAKPRRKRTSLMIHNPQPDTAAAASAVADAHCIVPGIIFYIKVRARSRWHSMAIVYLKYVNY